MYRTNVFDLVAKRINDYVDTYMLYKKGFVGIIIMAALFALPPALAAYIMLPHIGAEYEPVAKEVGALVGGLWCFLMLLTTGLVLHMLLGVRAHLFPLVAAVAVVYSFTTFTTPLYLIVLLTVLGIVLAEGYRGWKLVVVPAILFLGQFVVIYSVGFMYGFSARLIQMLIEVV